MNDLLFGLTLCTALGSGLMAGVFFTFSTFVMRIEAPAPSSPRRCRSSRRASMCRGRCAITRPKGWVYARTLTRGWAQKTSMHAWQVKESRSAMHAIGRLTIIHRRRKPSRKTSLVGPLVIERENNKHTAACAGGAPCLQWQERAVGCASSAKASVLTIIHSKPRQSG